MDKPTNPNENTASLRVIHRAMLIGQLLFLGIALFLSVSNNFPPSLQHLDKTMQVVAVVLSFVCVYFAITVFKRKWQEAREAATEEEQSRVLRSAYIVRWALIEGPAIFCIICFLLVGNYSFAALAGTLIVFFGLQAPIVQSKM